MTSLCNFPLRSFLMTSDNLISLLAINRWRWFYYQSEISDSHIFHLSSSFFFLLLIILSLLPLRIKQFFVYYHYWLMSSFSTPPQIKFHMKYFFGRICSDNISECVPPLNWILNISQHLLDVIRSEINFLKLLFVLFYCVLFFLLT